MGITPPPPRPTRTFQLARGDALYFRAQRRGWINPLGLTLTSTTQAFLLGPGDTARLTGTPPGPGTPRTLAGVLVDPGLEVVDLT